MKTGDPWLLLRTKLDKLPVGFPPGAAGLRLLHRLFEAEEARTALGMDWHWRRVEEIGLALDELGLERGPDLAARLDAMASKGSILRRASEGCYSLQPFVVGMYELQIARLSKGFVEDATDFLYGGFGLELLASGEAQSRVIPIGAAIRPEHRVASYEEFRELIGAAGERIAVLPCVCRSGADLQGKPCAATKRRELCIVFRDYADTVVREGWGRAIDVTEALALAAQNEAEGLVMRPSNEKEPQFLCACCGDCCGLIAVVKAMKRPADFVASNFRARVEAAACTGCALCAKRCPMEAISMLQPLTKRGASGGSVPVGAAPARPKARRPTARVEAARCIGCGVCVGACRFGAAILERKADREPPENTEALLERLAATRPGGFKKLSIGLRGILGVPMEGRYTKPRS